MRRRNARNSLLGSVLLMLLSCAMLLGTTFAWFSDTTTSGAATIQAGNLKVVLEYTKPSLQGTWQTAEDDTNIFDGVKYWEMGATAAAYFRVKNAGNLALQYEYSINVEENKLGTSQIGAESVDLTEYLQLKVMEFETYEDAIAIGKDVAGFWTSSAQEGNVVMPLGANLKDNPSDDKGKEGTAYTRSGGEIPGRTGDNCPTGKVIAVFIHMPNDGNAQEANCESENLPSFKLKFDVKATQASANNNQNMTQGSSGST